MDIHDVLAMVAAPGTIVGIISRRSQVRQGINVKLSLAKIVMSGENVF